MWVEKYSNADGLLWILRNKIIIKIQVKISLSGETH